MKNGFNYDFNKCYSRIWCVEITKKNSNLSYTASAKHSTKFVKELVSRIIAVEPLGAHCSGINDVAFQVGVGIHLKDQNRFKSFLSSHAPLHHF